MTARGNRRAPIFVDDVDRRRLLALFGVALERFEADALAFCLMSNHFHLVVRTRRANLSSLMRHINGTFTHVFNRRHGAVGHLFQGRFLSVVVDSDSHFVRVCSYNELNPVRAGLVREARDWHWSSYRAHVGLEAAPPWLDVDTLYGHVLGRDPCNDADRQSAMGHYAVLVEAGRHDRLWRDPLVKDGYLGDDAFIERVRRQVAPAPGVRPEA